MVEILEFEKPVAALDAELAALPEQARERPALAARRDRLLAEIYAGLTPWQVTQVARHPARPRFLAIAAALFEGWTPLAGDRAFADDPAMLGGPARFRGRPVMLIGQEKGHDTTSRVKRNFGMAMPEGYRKAARLMDLASRMALPIVTLVDTPGAFPGVGAEERGQAEAIARATEACFAARVPIVTVIIGEGMSGGALGIAAADRLLMLEHSIYAVISPEGCAAILWRGAGEAAAAAEAMRITARDLKALGVIDGVIREPLGGAHRAPAAAITAIGDAIDLALQDIADEGGDVRARRRAKFLTIARAA
jgi:acetyl-CoA carboxylase carboxyl transferase subunit alpha